MAFSRERRSDVDSESGDAAMNAAEHYLKDT